MIIWKESKIDIGSCGTVSECEHTGLNAHKCIYKSGSCYWYEVASKMCIIIDNDGTNDKPHWIFVGGCYEKGETMRYIEGEPNHSYNFNNL